MKLDVERLVRGDALDLAHNKARDEYFKAFENNYRKILVEQHNEERALAAADGAARRAYVETHCAVYREACGKERANFDDDARRSDKAA
jgi:hypothetical protein